LFHGSTIVPHGGLRIKILPSNRQNPSGKRYEGMLLLIAIILFLLWAAGFTLHLAGGLIHILLVIALIVFILHFVSGGRSV